MPNKFSILNSKPLILYSKPLILYLAFTIYFLLTIFFTYPLIRNMSSGIYGYPGDSLASIHSFWWKKDALLTGKTLSFFPNFNYPFGTVEPFLKEVLASFPAEVLTVFTNEIFAYNIFIFLSFPLAGLTMFLLVKYLSKNSLAAFIAGLIYAFCPYHIWQSYSHFSLSQIQWLPLFVLSLIKLDQPLSTKFLRLPRVRQLADLRGSWKFCSKQILLFGLAFTLVFWTSFYCGYFALLFLGVWVVAKSILSYLSKRENYISLPRLKAFVFAAVCTVIFSFPILLPILRQKLNDPYRLRAPLYQYKQLNISDFAAFTARPWDYFLPATDHFLFGEIIEKVYFKIREFGENSGGLNYIFKDAGRTEGTLYLGIIPIILVFVVAGPWPAQKKARRACLRRQERATTSPRIFAVLAIIFFLTSLLPYAGANHFKIIFPSYFLVQVFPMFRVLARMGIVVMLCISVLAGIGLSEILAKLAAPIEKLVVTCLVAVLVLVEFLNVPPFHFTDLTIRPEAYNWIAQQQGDFTIAEYPRGYDTNFSAFFQRIHGKKILSADLIGKDDFLNPNLDKKLKVYQVKYILFHKKQPFKDENPTNPAQSQYLQKKPTVTSENIVLVQSFEDTEIYEIR